MGRAERRDYLKYEPRWKILEKDGRPIKDYVQMQGKMGRNCWANAEFAKWWVDIVSRAIQEYAAPIWALTPGFAQSPIDIT